MSRSELRKCAAGEHMAGWWTPTCAACRCYVDTRVASTINLLMQERAIPTGLLIASRSGLHTQDVLQSLQRLTASGSIEAKAMEA